VSFFALRLRPRFVLFIDMLGFSQLTEDHPKPLVYDFESRDFYVAETSESAKQLGRFQQVLNRVPFLIDAWAPSHLMLFSDCAFLVFATALSSARAATELMRRFYLGAVPVRMGLAYGTWNADRFSFDSFNDITITRAVFYGTGVVRAHEAEKNSGKGLRVFVHASIANTDLKEIEDADLVLPVDADAGPRELNYLHDATATTPDLGDEMLRESFAKMRARLPASPPEKVVRHYTETFVTLNRMRRHWSRDPFVES
jgi:hypothetical protein